MPTPKVALITGASKRIGKAISQTLHAYGYHIIIHYHHSISEAQKLCDDLNALRPNSAITLQADLAIIDNADSLNIFTTQAINAFGRLDVLVHNASSFYPTPLNDTPANLHTAWQDLMLTNAKAPFFLSFAFKDALQSTKGTIISLLDIHAQNKPFIGYPIYTMAKSAHLAMVQALALELAPDVRVNGVSPGVNIFPDDDQNAVLNSQRRHILEQSAPLKRIGTPDDIAKAVLFLAQSDYIIGQILAVDGGRSLTLQGG